MEELEEQNQGVEAIPEVTPTEGESLEAGAEVPAGETTPEAAPEIDYKAEYEKQRSQMLQYDDGFKLMQEMAQKSDFEGMYRLMGVNAPPPLEETPQINPAEEYAKRLELDSEGMEATSNYIKSLVEPMLAESQKTIDQQQRALNFLLDDMGKKSVADIREKNPLFQKYEGKIEQILAKNPGLDAESAFRLASYDDIAKDSRADAVTKYKESVTKKKSPSSVMQGSSVTQTKPSELPKFKSFLEAYNYTKNQTQG